MPHGTAHTHLFTGRVCDARDHCLTGARMSAVLFSQRRMTVAIIGFIALVTLGGCGPGAEETRRLCEAISAHELGKP
jgi:hypothetical protein